MSDASRFTELAGHPDIIDMRERYDRITASGQAVVVDGPSPSRRCTSQSRY